MRNAGLPVEVMIEYVKLCQEGDNTIPARLQLLLDQRDALLDQKAQIDVTLERLNYKISRYEEAVKPENSPGTNVPRRMKTIRRKTMYLEKINAPEDVKKLNQDEMNALAAEMRQALMFRLSKHGGHFGELRHGGDDHRTALCV